LRRRTLIGFPIYCLAAVGTLARGLLFEGTPQP